MLVERTPIPIMNRRIVGVKVPESGSAIGLDVAVGAIVTAGDEPGVELAVGLTVGLDVGLDVGVSVVNGVADGVETNAGPSAAETIKVLDMVRNIPAASRHLIVTVCSPGSKLFGGFQFQLPPVEATTVPV
jgi:hypothetical protein